MNIKNYIKQKWNERKIKYNNYLMKSFLKGCSYISILSVILSFVFYILTKNLIDSTIIFALSEIFMFLTLLITEFIYKFEDYNLEKRENFDKLILERQLVKKALNGLITKKEEINIENICKNSILNKEEIEVIRRNILNENGSKSYKIDTEYLMLKFLIEIDKNEELKKKFNNPSQKIKGQMATLNEKIKTLKAI